MTHNYSNANVTAVVVTTWKDVWMARNRRPPSMVPSSLKMRQELSGVATGRVGTCPPYVGQGGS